MNIPGSPENYKNIYKNVIKLYRNELDLRESGAVTRTHFIKGSPYYSIEFDPQYITKFGIQYSQSIVYEEKPSSFASS